LPISVDGQTVELDVDITSQTLGTLAIDIAAQSLANVNVNIAAQAVTVNVKTPAGEHVDADIVSSITLDINLTGSTITLPVNIAAQAVTLAVDITAQTISTLDIDIAAQTLSDIDIDIVKQTEAVEERKEFQEGVTDWIVDGIVTLAAGDWGYVFVFIVPEGYKFRAYDFVLSGTQPAYWYIKDETGAVVALGYSGRYGNLVVSGSMAHVFPPGTYWFYAHNVSAETGEFVGYIRGWT